MERWHFSARHRKQSLRHQVLRAWQEIFSVKEMALEFAEVTAYTVRAACMHVLGK